MQRCQAHKTLNVIGYLPKHKRDWVKRMLRKAWASETAEEAIRQLHSLATGLQTQYPDAAASLREGLEETLTSLRLSILAYCKTVYVRRTPLNSPVVW
ncbi:MAG: transposase [bacterium]